MLHICKAYFIFNLKNYRIILSKNKSFDSLLENLPDCYFHYIWGNCLFLQEKKNVMPLTELADQYHELREKQFVDKIT